MPKTKFTSADILSALTLEARRLNISYAELSEQLKNSPCREQEIVNDYIKQKKENEKKKRDYCKGCVYCVLCPADKSKRMCSFSQTGRVRKRDADGNCQEYTTVKPHKRRNKTMFQRLLEGDWHDKTVPEIAVELCTSETRIHEMMYIARKKRGINIAFKKTLPGRKT